MDHDQRRNRAWPSVEWEKHEWALPVNAYVSNTARRRHTGAYTAAVPASIGSQPVVLDSGTIEAAEEAAYEIVRFDAEIGMRVMPFASLLLRSESAASSQIEQLTATAKAIALAELGDESKANATMIVWNVKAMKAALALAAQVSASSILAMHTALLEDERPEWVGHWRHVQVWIGGGRFGPHGAAFVPPHQTRVPAAIDDLVLFTGRHDVAPLVQAAITHAQFETIHPFPDGNGRTGRALIHSMLRHRGLTRNVTVPISAGLLVDLDAYFGALTVYRSGQVDQIVQLMAESSLSAIGNARTLVDEMDEIRDEWSGRVRARRDSAIWRLIDLLFRQPAVNSTVVQRELGVTAIPALNAIGQLEDLGILLKAKGEERNRAWVATDIVSALDDFAVRAGRRQRPA